MVKKILPYLFMLILGAVLCFFITQGQYSRTVDRLSARIVEGDELNQELRNTNKLLTDENRQSRELIESLRGDVTELQRINSEARIQLGDIRNIVGGIGTGLGEGARTIQSVIDGLEQVKSAVQLLP